MYDIDFNVIFFENLFYDLVLETSEKNNKIANIINNYIITSIINRIQSWILYELLYSLNIHLISRIYDDTKIINVRHVIHCV